ncbi:MAG: FeoC-like transcriptional regulator [Legionellaceae bacterium]|nr:FeoC-like transcriptional regulator [Legionellaceae bacterium]
MLLQLRDYLAKEQYVSLDQLSRVFKIDKTALLPMLDVWVARGVIQVDEVGKKKISCATACGECEGDAPTYYRYIVA